MLALRSDDADTQETFDFVRAVSTGRSPELVKAIQREIRDRMGAALREGSPEQEERGVDVLLPDECAGEGARGGGFGRDIATCRRHVAVTLPYHR